MEFLGTLDKLDVKGLEPKNEWKDYKENATQTTVMRTMTIKRLLE